MWLTASLCRLVTSAHADADVAKAKSNTAKVHFVESVVALGRDGRWDGMAVMKLSSWGEATANRRQTRPAGGHRLDAMQVTFSAGCADLPLSVRPKHRLLAVWPHALLS